MRALIVAPISCRQVMGIEYLQCKTFEVQVVRGYNVLITLPDRQLRKQTSSYSIISTCLTLKFHRTCWRSSLNQKTALLFLTRHIILTMFALKPILSNSTTKLLEQLPIIFANFKIGSKWSTSKIRKHSRLNSQRLCSISDKNLERICNKDRDNKFWVIIFLRRLATIDYFWVLFIWLSSS